ncbi:MAG: DUF4058 family protein [Cyanobacteria bacterium P01_C01_bin.120]
MPSPFPGMDPFLEAADIWPEVHSRLIVALADALAPALMPDYYVAIEKRIYISTPDDNLLIGVPDAIVMGQPTTSMPSVLAPNVATLAKNDQPQTVILPLAEEVQERYLEIRETQTEKVITLVEVLSPKNKRPGEGRQAYLRKRQRVLTSATHLVEIDLLSQGLPMPMQGNIRPSAYRILVSSSQQRPQAALYAFNLPDPIPAFHLPLRSQKPEPLIDLKPLLDGIYDRAGYSLRLSLTPDALPALSPEAKAWVTTLLPVANQS